MVRKWYYVGHSKSNTSYFQGNDNDKEHNKTDRENSQLQNAISKHGHYHYFCIFTSGVQESASHAC